MPCETTCALCQSPIRQHKYTDQDKGFCCAGCHAVYQILSKQQNLTQFQDHPLFQQAVRSGIISNPDLLEQLRAQRNDSPAEELEKLHLEIGEMWCPSCAEVIRLILLREKGVQACVVDYSTDLASVTYAPRYISKERIFKLIAQLGYRPASLEDPRQAAVSRTLYLQFIVAAFCSLNVMMFAYPIYSSYFGNESSGHTLLFAWISLAASIPVLTFSAWPIWRRFWTGIQVGVWGMETLVVIGVAAATALSLYEMSRGSAFVYFDSMTVIIVFVLLGKIIESKAKFSAKDSLLRLTRALPRRGRKQETSGEEHFVPLKEIVPGERIVALMGEKIVLDGVVEEGEGTCDESLMTGESIPIAKRVGSMVLAGSLLQQGRLVIRVTAKPEETALHRIIEMVEREVGHKSKYVHAADAVVKVFVPLVVLLAIGTALCCYYFGIADTGYTVLQTAFVRAISVLLISCPCAIGIAAPLAESSLLNALARLGAIVRNRGCLAFLGRETAFVFDKTGTITEGQFTVLAGIEQLSKQEQSQLKGLVVQSIHPIAMAIQRSICALPTPFSHVEEVIGRGLRSGKGDQAILLGSTAFLSEQQISVGQHNHHQVETAVFFAKNRECLARIVLGDRIRSGARELVQSLSGLHTMLVSGDSPEAVKVVAKECGFKEWRAGCHPLEKKELIDALKQQGHIVAMLGDGINDAPALTAAHVGMAVVSATDISIQVSDILLTTDRLEVIPRLHQLAKKGRHIVRQNLFWAFFYNVVGIGLAMAGVLSPLFAACAMVASSCIVLFNAQRIR